MGTNCARDRYRDGLIVETESTSVGHTRADLTGWLSAAALFWFEAWGLMGLLVIAVGPLIAFMHGSWPPSTWADGTPLRFAAVLAVVGVGAILIWTITAGRPRLRAAIFTAIGLVGIIAVAAAATLETYVFAGVALWLAWPSVVLVVVWGRRLLRADATTG